MIFAYLDAGSGSLLLQAILGGIAGIVIAAKAWKARFFRGKNPAAKGEAEDAVEDAALTTET